MKKSLMLLAGASMLFLGVPSVTHAQAGAASGPFADVPADHWAYQSVDNLQKAGIVIGYPDGTYGGKRAMTRYEFAVAIARLLPLLHPDMSNMSTKDDLAALRSDLESKLAANSAAIDDLKKLINEFQAELTKLGQDVEAIKARLDALETRVAAVEAEQRRVKFNGALNLIARGDNITKGNEFTDKNGILQTGNKHLLTNADVYHDFVLGITGRLSDTATANVKLDFGNYLSALGNTAAIGFAPGGLGFTGSGINPGQLTPANQQTTVWEAYLESPVSLGPLGGADLVAGRFGTQFTKYTLKQIDSDVYTSLYQTDDGNIMTDGAKATLKLGPVGTTLLAGKLSAIPYSQPYGGSSYVAGQTRPTGTIASNHAASLTQMEAARFTLGAPKAAVLGFTVEQFGLDTATNIAPSDPNLILSGTAKSAYNRLSVYGADFSGAVPFLSKTGLTLNASITESMHGSGSGFNNVGQGWRYTSTDDQLGIKLGGLSLSGGYQYIGPEFTAPGYWGKIGSWTNPTNVSGGVVTGKFAFTPRLSLNADYEGYKAAYGTTSQGLTISSPLQQGDKLNRYQVGLGYGLTSAYSVDLGYEHVEYDLKDNSATLVKAGKPTETYITIGLGHSFNPNASFKLLYQIVQYDDKNTNFDPLSGGGKTQGNVAVGQFSLKF